MALGGQVRWRRILGRLDIRSKSEGAIAFCARSQISGGSTQILVAAMTAAIFWESELANIMLAWMFAIILLSLYRLLSSAWLLRRINDRRAAGFWGVSNQINFLLQGLTWAALAWMPLDTGDFGALFLVFFIPVGIVAAATYNLNALPLGLVALAYPIAISHFFAGLYVLGGSSGVLLAICAVIFMVVTTAGAIMSNATLVSECRLAHANRFMAARSKAALAALREKEEQLLEVNRRLEQLASHDALTGLPNRRMLMQRLGEERSRASRSGGTFSLLLIDLDHFKSINDGFGHQVGDIVLVEVGQRLSQGLRGGDLAARHGGEEFAILLADTSLAGAVTVAERVRARLRELPIRVDDTPVCITGSIGVATWRGEWDRVESLMSRADQALYSAKEKGRDRVEAMDDLTLAGRPPGPPEPAAAAS